jgi:FPC/CPF motif-containing protein YcgG
MPSLSPPRRSCAAFKDAFIARFKTFVGQRTFPCVGAKSALHRDRMEFGLYDRLTDQGAAAQLCEHLADFSDRHPTPGVEPVSFVAMFRQPVANEDEFHAMLWKHLQAMHDLDSVAHPWDASVSADPASNQFSFSVAERGFFVVGLHPGSSREARQAPFPCLVFNFHDQFEAMRASGRYEKLQRAIRERDVALQGSINPVLARFGEASEAVQYSGHAGAVGCPFHARQG